MRGEEKVHRGASQIAVETGRFVPQLIIC